MLESLTTSLTSFFVHPGFILPGAALIAAPIIIHFINRLRFRRVKWAAMEFLLASQQRNRRRLLLEQLLLLLLRILAVAALVMLVARPLIDPQRFSQLLGQKTHHLVLLDDSGSMRDRTGETAAFETGLDVLRKLVAEGERRPDSQTLTLLLLSNPSQPIFTQENLNQDFVTRVEGTLKGLRCSHRALDLVAGVEAARKLLAEMTGAARNFHLISDFRRQDWEDNSALPAALRELDLDKVLINLIQTVPEAHANLGITDLTGTVDVAAVNVPLRLKAAIRNYGEQVVRDVRLTILIDGQKQPSTEGIDKIEPGRERAIEFDVKFASTGPHSVEVQLPADALDQDNSRYLSLQIADTIPVLVIYGGTDENEALYLIDALGAAPEKTGFSPTRDRIDSLRRQPLEKFKSIFLLNVSELPPDAIKALEEYVRGGGGLAWFLGSQVRPAFYNDKLAGAVPGLFPAKLGGIAELFLDESNPAPDFSVTDHPVLEVFQDDRDVLLSYTKVHRYFSVAKDWTVPDGVRVIATLRNKAPLMLEHRLGKGRIITCLTACGDLSWNNWPRIPDAFVPVQLQLATYLAEGRRTLQSRTVGESLAISLAASAYAPQIEIRPPDGNRVLMTAGIKLPADTEPPAQTSSGLEYEESFRNTDVPGDYALILKRADGGEEVRHYAFNVADTESRLQLAASDSIRRRLGPEVNAQIQEFGNLLWVHAEDTSHEIHDYVLLLLLIVLLGEQALALRLSYHPRPVGGAP